MVENLENSESNSIQERLEKKNSLPLLAWNGKLAYFKAALKAKQALG